MTRPVLRPLAVPPWVKDVEELARRLRDNEAGEKFGLIQLAAALRRAYQLGVDPLSELEEKITAAEGRQPKRTVGEGKRGPSPDVERHTRWRRAFPRLLTFRAMSRAADSARTLPGADRRERVRRAMDRAWASALRRHGVNASPLSRALAFGDEAWAITALERVLQRRTRGASVSHEEWACDTWNAQERERVDVRDWEEMNTWWKKLTPSPERRQ